MPVASTVWLIGDRTLCRPIWSVIVLVINRIRLPLRGRPILLITPAPVKGIKNQLAHLFLFLTIYILFWFVTITQDSLE